MTVTDDLVKRLRGTYRKEFAPTGSMVATPRTVQSRLLSVDVLFNPDGAEAADRIEALTAENERLRVQLADLANTINIVGSHYHKAQVALDDLVLDVKKRARAALGDTQ